MATDYDKYLGSYSSNVYQGIPDLSRRNKDKDKPVTAKTAAWAYADDIVFLVLFAMLKGYKKPGSGKTSRVVNKIVGKIPGWASNVTGIVTGSDFTGGYSYDPKPGSPGTSGAFKIMEANRIGNLLGHLHEETESAVHQGMSIKEAVDLVSGTPGGLQLKNLMRLKTNGEVSRLLSKGIKVAFLGGAILFGGHAQAQTPYQASSLLRSDIASVENIYDKNLATRTNASNLLYETAVHESGLLKYDRQVGGGPALSKFQIEPKTAKNLVNWAKNRPHARSLLSTESGFTYKQLSNMTREQLGTYLVKNEKFAVAMARLKYASSPGKIPSTLEARSHYWSKYYQGTNNPTKQEKYISDSRKMAEEVKASSISKVVGSHLKPLHRHPSVVSMHNNKIGHNIKSIAKKLSMRGM